MLTFICGLLILKQSSSPYGIARPLEREWALAHQLEDEDDFKEDRLFVLYAYS